jgi:hypothetical protein
MCRQCFEPFGKVDRIKKIKDYAFVHFEERDNAVEGGTTQLSIYNTNSFPVSVLIISGLIKKPFCLVQGRVSDPHWFNADPDTDPDPALS